MRLRKSSVRKLIEVLCLSFCTTSAMATNHHAYISAGVGGSQARLSANNPEINYYDGNLTDAYPLNHSRASTAVVSLNAGYEFKVCSMQPTIAVGLGVYTNPTPYGYSGQLIETASGDPANTLYNYTYNVTSTRVMAEAQLTWTVGNFTPFINVGVGPAWNDMNGYTEAPVDSEGYVALPPFSSRTSTNLAYQAGFGVGYAFNVEGNDSAFKHERISVGYRYVNLGNTSFGTRGAEYPYALRTGSLTSNDVYLTYTHLF